MWKQLWRSITFSKVAGFSELLNNVSTEQLHATYTWNLVCINSIHWIIYGMKKIAYCNNALKSFYAVLISKSDFIVRNDNATQNHRNIFYRRIVVTHSEGFFRGYGKQALALNGLIEMEQCLPPKNIWNHKLDLL